MAAPVSGRGPYTLLLLAAGGASAFVTGSLWPLTFALTAMALGFFTVRAPRRLASGAAAPSRAAVSALRTESRRRYFELERVRNDIVGMLEASGRDPSLWQPEMERIDGLVASFVTLAGSVERDETFEGDDVDLELRLTELRAAGPSPELERAEERWEVALARKTSAVQRRDRLREIEDAMGLVRDRIASLGDDSELGPELEALMGGVEAAASAEMETRQLVASARRQLDGSA